MSSAMSTIITISSELHAPIAGDFPLVLFFVIEFDVANTPSKQKHGNCYVVYSEVKMQRRTMDVFVLFLLYSMLYGSGFRREVFVLTLVFFTPVFYLEKLFHARGHITDNRSVG